MRRVCPRGHETYDDTETACRYCELPLPPVDRAETTWWPRPETPTEEPEPSGDEETAAIDEPERDDLPAGYADVIISPWPDDGETGSVEWHDGLTVVLPQRVHQDPVAPTATLRLSIDTSAPIPAPSSRELNLALKFQSPQQPPHEPDHEPPLPGRSTTIIAAAAVGLLVSLLAGYLIGRATSTRSSTATHQSGRILTSTPSAGSTPLLRAGDHNDDVRRLQKALTVAHFPPGEIDGIFGGSTRRELRLFQHDRGLDETEETDPATWWALHAAGG
jgi:hypothetical protein